MRFRLAFRSIAGTRRWPSLPGPGPAREVPDDHYDPIHCPRHYVIEQIIANFKTWRIMHTDYRRPIATFATTISTVIALHFYSAS